ncbi:hypothetical protein CH300_20215 [Rhodococcus sp. 15-1154-1]|nr:hypothetical protein [Rhodococcus sp. 15-1154-1]OZF00863.1 hypothetical protein CH300_20215 [Rhodococcus sp. 15-1154-1]
MSARDRVAVAWRRMLDNRLMVQLRPFSIRLIEKAVLLQAALRGLDYILLPTATAPIASLFVVERALPLWLWGCGYLGWALVAYAGMWWKQTPFAAVGHFSLGVIFGLFAVFSLAEIIGREGELYGWRTGTAWVVASLIHFVYAREAERTWRAQRGS